MSEAGGGDTRERIMQAARDTLAAEGIAGATARAIARRGDFNQALIFYHFGSIPRLLMEAFRHTSAEQVARYRDAAQGVSSLRDLVSIARRLHDEDLQSGNVTAVTQLMAAASDRELGGRLLDGFEEWISLVEDALERALPEGAAGLVPTRPAAYAICAMFLGIELMTRLDPQRSEADEVFEMMAAIAQLIEQLAPVLLASR